MARRLVAIGKGGELVGRVSFWYGGGGRGGVLENSYFWRVLLRSGSGDGSLLYLSLSLWLTGGPVVYLC